MAASLDRVKRGSLNSRKQQGMLAFIGLYAADFRRGRGMCGAERLLGQGFRLALLA